MGDQSRALHTPPSSSSGSSSTFQTGLKRSPSKTPRPEMQMSIAQAGHPQGQQQPQRPAPPRFHHYAPPPLAPYVGRDERVVPPTPSAEGWLRHDAPSHPTHPSIPPPQRPAPPHIPPPPRAKQDTAPPSPPASRGQYPADEGAEGYSDGAARTHSAGSAQSGLSASSARLDGDISSSPEGKRSRDHATSETAASGSSSEQTEPKPRKRTRVLMTHMQGTRLAALWHENRFPSTQQREELGSEVGLTPRQVQVWFQNRRQNARKQFNQAGIPEGANVAEYEDLQKSPRSRRLSMGSSAQEDRTSRWAASSSSTGYTSVSSYSRASGSGIGGGLASIGESASELPF
ncbi:hypothetical protein BCR39DRAFT_196048 [Naematelia encephala]|uniref:Homeobox domain-containing protein n=1 Tax=Naematelia encephala TaxID=71784 RepID=A0A1Y2BHQ4_9TREE|nr:hypothetical protein BCR39DRAFT_196048 [Naematelia encephala]